ncbi:hypothetical protein ACFOSV_05705 [Algoriphagus namhaensis]|uniref:Uncharacterized protein n=1 Tax=Algoriphagus namhaensis TaxID=915353 RepID=A0ABV8ANR1_9BACT
MNNFYIEIVIRKQVRNIMFTKTINTSLNSKFLTLFVMSFGFFAIESFAQSEQEPVRMEIPAETPAVDDLDLTRGNISKEIQKKPASQSFIKAVSPQAKNNKSATEPIAENKDAKKEESASTLSFNLFLYIVDKFRAD